MSEISQFLLVIGVFLVLLIGGLWIPFAIAISASFYVYISMGWGGFNGFGLATWGSLNSFTLTAIPLFILMAEIMLQSGLSERVYRGLSHLVRKLPGGLLQTNIAGCAVFSAISGSSVATAVAIGSVAMPQLDQRGYSIGLSAGTLAAGGTLGILIPPSIAMIIYGTFTETSITKLFMAGLIPGLVLVALFMIYVGIRCIINPSLAPQEKDQIVVSWLQTAADILPFSLLIAGVMTGLYTGIVTPTEAAALGVCLAVIIASLWGQFNLQILRKSLYRTVQTSGAILFIVYAAFLFSYAVAMVGIADELTGILKSLNLTQFGLFIGIVILFTLLGLVIDSIGMMVITIPILTPILNSYGIDLIWFGVLMVVLIELGQVTPPVGMNLFVVKSIAPRATLGQVILGTLPFCALLYVLIFMLFWLPELALWLPGQMFDR
jgi:tripartite ATP-independent transporter DctM subunit